MLDKNVVGSVEYEATDDEYFEKRQLKHHARVWSLWALGVGAVISGDFFGWNFGLAAGGFGGLLIATGIITIMYLGLCYSIAEMCPALPHSGGAYSFGRSAMGPWGGFITGLGENIEYVLTPAVIVVGIGGYLGAIFGTPDSSAEIDERSASPAPCLWPSRFQSCPSASTPAPGFAQLGSREPSTSTSRPGGVSIPRSE